MCELWGICFLSVKLQRWKRFFDDAKKHEISFTVFNLFILKNI